MPAPDLWGPIPAKRGDRLKNRAGRLLSPCASPAPRFENAILASVDILNRISGQR